MLTAARNRIGYGDFVLSYLINESEFECCQGFNCGDEDLNEFFQCDARAHKDELIATTYCLRLKKVKGDDESEPLAFISFSNDIIPTAKSRNLKKFKKEFEEKIPEAKQKYHAFPAVKIGRLGVQVGYQKQNIGTLLLNIVKLLFITNNRTGCRYITVDAYNNEKVLNFYLKNDFRYLHDDDSKRDTRIMYFDLKRLIVDPAEQQLITIG